MGTGKCSYIGSFQSYTLPYFPYTVPNFFVTPLITNVSDEKVLNINIRIENIDTGIVVGQSALGIQFAKASQRNDIYEVPVVMHPIPFAGPGNYKVIVMVNNEKIGERNLPVKAPTTNPPPQKPS